MARITPGELHFSEAVSAIIIVHPQLPNPPPHEP